MRISGLVGTFSGPRDLLLRRTRHLTRGTRLTAAATAASLALLSGCSSGGRLARTASSHPASEAGGTAQHWASDEGGPDSTGLCKGTIGTVRVGDVHVPPGATCTLRGTTVSGQVSIGSGGTLIAHGAVVGGDVEGRGTQYVAILSWSSIGGALNLVQGGAATIRHARIGRNVQWTMQRGQLALQQTIIRGDLDLDQNRGAVLIARNRIGGDLQCHHNSRRPVRISNVIAGQRAGQCAWVGRRVTRHGTVRMPLPLARHPHVSSPRPPCAGDSVSDDPSDDQCDD
jgi:hypothetical protein